MIGRAYKRLVNNIVQSLKPIYGKKPLGKLMLASNTLKNELRNTTDEDNWIQLELNFWWKTQDIKKIIVRLANILKSYNVMQLQVDKI